MKTFYKLFLLAFVITLATKSEAQSRKLIYDEHEITQPNFLQYNLDGAKGNSIKGTVDNNQVNISWQTKAETNTSHFELQRSENGKEYEPIETITAGGISKNIHSYATTDEPTGLSHHRLYYRLKIVFINGKESFTNAIQLNSNSIATIAAYDLP